ncbi:MAG: hypothetical protein ACN6PY_11115, partial [Paraburkholderia nemoris]
DDHCTRGSSDERVKTTLLRGFGIWIIHIGLRLEQSRLLLRLSVGQIDPGRVSICNHFRAIISALSRQSARRAAGRLIPCGSAAT